MKDWPPYLDSPKPIKKIHTVNYCEYFKVFDVESNSYCSMPGICSMGFSEEMTKFKTLKEAENVKEMLEFNDKDKAEHIVDATYIPHTYKIFKFKEHIQTEIEEVI